MLATACLSAVRRASLVFALKCGNGTIRHNKIKRVTKISPPILSVFISCTCTYSDRQFVDAGYSIDCELGHAVSRSDALHGTRLNHNGYTCRGAVIGVQNLKLQADAHISQRHFSVREDLF